MASAAERSDRLHRAAIGYLVKRRFSAYREVGVIPRGRRRLDILALNMRRDLVGVEVKQGWADFASDQKHLDYLPYCNQLYFCLPYDFGPRRLEQAGGMIGAEIGIMLLESTGLVRVTRPARFRSIEQANIRQVVTKLAWRGGTGRHNSRRNRVYL